MQCKGLKDRLQYLVPLLTVCLGALVYFQEPVALVHLRNVSFDQFQRWHPRTYYAPRSEQQKFPVLVVDIDDESLNKLGQWPWPRTRIAELVTRLQHLQAAAIVFDVIFAEPDRTSPKEMLKLWKTTPEVSKELSVLPDHDEVFSKAIANGRVVLGFTFQTPKENLARPDDNALFIKQGGNSLCNELKADNILCPLPSFEAVAEGSGTLNFLPDTDGLVRKVPLFVRQNDNLLPSLSAEALRVALGAKIYSSRPMPDGVGLSEIRIGRLKIPVTPQGEAWLYYRKPDAGLYIPIWKVLAGVVPAEQFNHAIVLIGSSAPVLRDQLFNPIEDNVMSGIEAHAQLLEQIQAGQYLSRPAWAFTIEFVCVVVGGLLLGLIALATGAIRSFVFCLLSLLLLWLGAFQAFVRGGFLLDPSYPSLVLVLSYIFSSIVHHLYSERRQSWVKQAFSRYISPNLVNFLIDHPDALELGGKRQQCSFVFTDLAGFTPLMESMDPSDAVAVLNEYLDGMIKIAFSHHGTLDRIVGDAVAIMFSAPVPQSDHQQRALICALDMQRFASGYEEDLRRRKIVFAKTRIGVHTGEVIVGNFGGSTIFDYRALGDPVNTASRLEAANKYLGTFICVSEATLSACLDFPARPAGRLVLKGKSQAVMVYEPLMPDSETRYDRQAYCEAYELMRAGLPDALAAFEQLYARYPDDPLVNLHLGRLRAGVKDDLIVLKEK